ncbi:MAG: LysR family transcriptional regulator [Alphaproteobacteria bacterium]|nr:LysR family transcriptional regulator [Alphaproteobacteria bacterium]MCB9696069.1 LysR family transcriptional regulator [Alphaproteobacteria bacterium]
MDVLGQMHLFVKVVESGGFTTAGRELGLPKSTVSRQIARLEDRLGVRLLERTTRSLRPTEAGQAYYERCVRIVADVMDAENAVTQGQREPRGTLRISAPMSLGYRYLGDALGAFLRTYPQLRVEVSLSDRRVDLIDEGYDVAVRIGVLDDSSMIARRLGPTHMSIVGAPSYFAEHGTPESPEELRHHACFQYEYGPTLSTWRLGPELTIPVKGPMVSNNGDVLLAAARAGVGLALLPRFIVRDDLASGALVTVLDEHVTQSLAMWAVYPANRYLSSKVRAFVDFVVAWVDTHPAE